MSLETVALEHVPPTHQIHVAFFKNVANASFLQSQLLARNAAFEYAFIDAAVVVSRFQILAAVFKGLTGLLDGNLKTPNVHSEIVYSLNSNNNITEAYRRYGISPDTKDVIIVKVVYPSDPSSIAPSADDIRAHLTQNVQGTAVPLTDESIAGSTDWAKVKKYYKLNGAPSLTAIKDASQLARETEVLVVGAMALRSV